MTKLLTRDDMDGLSVPELESLLNRQIAEKRLLQDRRSENIAQLGTNAMNINNLRSKIGSFRGGDKPVEISDHAMLRYLQRVCGLDLDVVKAKLDTPELRECIQRCPTGRHTINGVIYVIKDGALVTVIFEEAPRGDEEIPVASRTPIPESVA